MITLNITMFKNENYCNYTAKKRRYNLLTVRMADKSSKNWYLEVNWLIKLFFYGKHRENITEMANFWCDII